MGEHNHHIAKPLGSDILYFHQHKLYFCVMMLLFCLLLLSFFFVIVITNMYE